MARFIRFFEEIGIDDVPLVGGKNASLGEMYRELSGEGVRVPNGFATTAEAYWYMLEQAGALEQLHEALDGLDPADVQDLARRGTLARDIAYGAGLPEDLKVEILKAYAALRDEYGIELSVAVRSCDSRGLAHGKLRRPARNLPQRARRGDAPGCLPALLRQPVHRPCDPLPP